MSLCVTDTELRPIRVVLFGMDDRSKSRMETVFKIIFKGRCESIDLSNSSGENTPDVGILDIDGWKDKNECHNAWDHFKELNPTLPTIVLASNTASIDGVTCLSKPAKLDLLWAAIEQCLTGMPILSNSTPDTKPEPAEIIEITSKKPSSIKIETDIQIDAVACKTNTAYAMETKYEVPRNGPQIVNRSYTDTDEDLFFNPDDYLLGVLKNNLDEINTKPDTSLLVRCWKNRTVVISPNKDIVYSELNDVQLKTLGIAKITDNSNFHIEKIDSDYANTLVIKNNPKAKVLSISAFLWDIALRTSRGRIPIGSQTSSPIYLRNWPNLTRLSYTPHAMRISAFLVGNPCSITEISKKLNIDQKHVFSFYTAASAIGLSGSASRQADTILEPHSISNNSGKRGLLASILRKIASA